MAARIASRRDGSSAIWRLFFFDVLGCFIELRQQLNEPVRNTLLDDIVVQGAKLIADLGLDIAVKESLRNTAHFSSPFRRLSP